MTKADPQFETELVRVERMKELLKAERLVEQAAELLRYWNIQGEWLDKRDQWLRDAGVEK